MAKVSQGNGGEEMKKIRFNTKTSVIDEWWESKGRCPYIKILGWVFFKHDFVDWLIRKYRALQKSSQSMEVK